MNNFNRILTDNMLLLLYIKTKLLVPQTKFWVHNLGAQKVCMRTIFNHSDLVACVF